MPPADRHIQRTHALLTELLALCGQARARASEVRGDAAMARARSAALAEATAILLSESMEARLEIEEMRVRRAAQQDRR